MQFLNDICKKCYNNTVNIRTYRKINIKDEKFAIYQNFNLIHDEDPKHVLVFGADHVYRMDPEQMFNFHRDHQAGVTVAAIRVKRNEATEFGCIELDNDGITIKAFHEKPKDPPGIPGNEDYTLVSMGNYIFKRDEMEDALILDSEDIESKHDLGTNIIPMMTAMGRAFAYDFANNHVPGETDRDRGYWRDDQAMARARQSVNNLFARHQTQPEI